MKNLLCILCHPPYAGSHAIELFEAAMVGAVFDFNVAILLRDDAVWTLTADQDGSLLGTRTPGKVLGALPTYEVNQIYVCETSLEVRGLEVATAIVPIQPISLDKQRTLIQSQDLVLGGHA